MSLGRSELRFTQCVTEASHIQPKLLILQLFHERKMEKMAAVLVRAAGIKQLQNLLIAEEGS